jgi:hypothetical protein
MKFTIQVLIQSPGSLPLRVPLPTIERSCDLVESTINQVISKRFVKRQQMLWTPRGAHLLLQIRVPALNDDLHTAIQRWYPDLKPNREEKPAA